MRTIVVILTLLAFVCVANADDVSKGINYGATASCALGNPLGCAVSLPFFITDVAKTVSGSNKASEVDREMLEKRKLAGKALTYTRESTNEELEEYCKKYPAEAEQMRLLRAALPNDAKGDAAAKIYLSKYPKDEKMLASKKSAYEYQYLSENLSGDEKDHFKDKWKVATSGSQEAESAAKEIISKYPKVEIYCRNSQKMRIMARYIAEQYKAKIPRDQIRKNVREKAIALGLEPSPAPDKAIGQAAPSETQQQKSIK